MMKLLPTVVTSFLYLLSIIGFPFGSYAVGAASPKIISGEINKVKLYSDRAEIYREIKLQLSGATSHFDIGPLPDKLIANSLQIFSIDDSSLQIGNFQLERVFESNFISQPIQIQNELVQKLQNNLNELKDQQSIFDDQIRFIESIQQPRSQVATGNFQGPDFWDSVLKFKASRGETTRDHRRNLIKEIQESKDRLENEKKKLESMKADTKKGYYLASFDINASNITEIRLGLVYQIRNAGWKPAYHLHTDTLTQKVTVSYFGEIDQSTGEDWDNVSMELSTGQPSRGTLPPKLRPWIVDFSKPVKELFSSNKAAAPRQLMTLQQEPAKSDAKEETVEVVDAGTSYTFRIPQKQTITAGTRKFRALIAKTMLDGNLAYTVIPKISPRVFLQAKLKNTSDFQFLPGQSGTYLDGSFVGNSWMKSTSPGQTLELGLGADDSIRVERKLLKKEDGGEGFFGQNDKARYIFEIKIENFKKQPVKLTLKDQLPLPYHEDIQVQVNQIEPKANETDKQNFLTWNLELAPEEKKSITLDFQVEYPKGKAITGL